MNQHDTERNEVLTVLEQMHEYRDYDRLAVPSEIDGLVRQLLSEVVDRASYQALRSILKHEHRYGLAMFGWRAPSWAVQERSDALLRQGLIALALSGLDRYTEEALAVPLYGRSCYLLGVPREEVFGEVIAIVEEPVGALLREYLQVAPLEREPISGFREVCDGAGFRFEFLGFSEQ